MSKAYDNPEVAGRYDAARAMPEETLKQWMEELIRGLPPVKIGRMLDLGCGTGRFACALVAAFGCHVIGVDPSVAMLEQARQRWGGEIEWKQGSAESIPLDSRSIDLVWMSQVYHHLDEAPRAFQDIHRVIRAGGCLAIRNGTRENLRDIEWMRCFPEAYALDQARLPSRPQIERTVAEHGFSPVLSTTVYQKFASSYEEYLQKISQRGLSSLTAISDEAFRAGLEELRRWVDQQPRDKPVFEPVDFCIFRALNVRV